MGAATFFVEAKGTTAKEAFQNAILNTRHQICFGGYSGTIAEKDNFIMISLPVNENPLDYANKLIYAEDKRINDKWGPAGCIKIREKEYLFFGWASI